MCPRNDKENYMYVISPIVENHNCVEWVLLKTCNIMVRIGVNNPKNIMNDRMTYLKIITAVNDNE